MNGKTLPTEASNGRPRDKPVATSACVASPRKRYCPPTASMEGSRRNLNQKVMNIGKNLYFKKNPDADADKDGTLSWPELHAHKKGECKPSTIDKIKHIVSARV